MTSAAREQFIGVHNLLVNDKSAKIKCHKVIWSDKNNAMLKYQVGLVISSLASQLVAYLFFSYIFVV